MRHKQSGIFAGIIAVAAIATWVSMAVADDSGDDDDMDDGSDGAGVGSTDGFSQDSITDTELSVDIADPSMSFEISVARSGYQNLDQYTQQQGWGSWASFATGYFDAW